jgi:hypothetical protein
VRLDHAIQLFTAGFHPLSLRRCDTKDQARLSAKGIRQAEAHNAAVSKDEVATPREHLSEIRKMQKQDVDPALVALKPLRASAMRSPMVLQKAFSSGGIGIIGWGAVTVEIAMLI